MSERIQAIRGMNDILPEQAAFWQTLERRAAETFQSYGYSPIRLPIVERTELFKRSIGEVTDIVEKEMYTFQDRGGESVSLRPEGTAGAVRAGIEHGLLYNQVQRLWYAGPMFRYERPQKGRYRQFHQIGVEAFGLDGPDVDAELILMSARLWHRLGIRGLTLKLNSLGTLEARKAYRERLIDYFSAHDDVLDADSRRRLHTNPLRILDSKNAQMREVIEGAPSLLDHLDPESAAHFSKLLALLDAAGLEYQIDPRLVRGLDYYSRTVFEWITHDLGAQDAVCSGGRYDDLVTQLGGRPTPGIGFAMGVERLVALMRQQAVAVDDVAPHVYLAWSGDEAQATAMALAERLRDSLPGLRMLMHAGGGGFKAQLRRADRSGARYALILGPTEMGSRRVQIKPLRTEEPQAEWPWNELAPMLAARLGLASHEQAATEEY